MGKNRSAKQDTKVGKSKRAEALCSDKAEQPRIPRKRSWYSNQKCKHKKQTLPDKLVFNQTRERKDQRPLSTQSRGYKDTAGTGLHRQTGLKIQET